MDYGLEMSSDKPRRKIKLETRFGSARESRSRKDRPCDLCRQRKSACVIPLKPPCRFCENRGVECTFATAPRPRRRGDAGSTSDQGTPPNEDPSPPEQVASTPEDKVSPQASRFPVPPGQLRRGSDDPYITSPNSSTGTSTAAVRSYSRQYLSLQQLTSEAEIPSPTYSETYAQPHGYHGYVQGNHHAWEQERIKNSLERGKNSTAHFVGMSGEQDTNLFASIRYNILNEIKYVDFNIRNVYEGDAGEGKPPIHFSIVNDSFSERDQRAKRLASDNIEAHVRGHGDTLIRLYFQFVHPTFPILSKLHILNQYATDKLSISASLRGVIYGLGCAMWTRDPTLNHVPPITQLELFEYAHAALNRELDSPKLSTLQTCLLILHEQAEPSGTTESPRIWTLACQATACAQSLGLHQDPMKWKIPSWEKRLRKKLWWATYITDLWTSICHGQTPHIVDGSYDTSELTMEDLVYDEDVAGVPGEHLLTDEDRSIDRDNALRFLELLRLTKILSGTVKNAFTLQGYKQTIQKVDVEGRETIIWKHKAAVDQILSHLPPSLTMDRAHTIAALTVNANFHLGVFALKFLIHRALMAPATTDLRRHPTSSLYKHYPDALQEGENFMIYMNQLSKMDLHIFWPRHSRTNLIIAGNHLIYLFFCAATQDQVTKAYSMLEKYRNILKAMVGMADWSTIGLIRPSLLRAEGFFNGAAEGIRMSGTQ